MNIYYLAKDDTSIVTSQDVQRLWSDHIRQVPTNLNLFSSSLMSEEK
jgi:hypothetical protein